MLRTLAIPICLTAAYVVAGALGLMLAVPPGYATGVFVPAGLAISAMLIFGPISLPGTFFGALLLNLGVGYLVAPPLDATKLWAALVIALASTVQAFLGSRIFDGAIGHPARLDSGRDVARFLGFSPVVCLVSATLSLAGLAVLGAVKQEELAESWLTWWIGDTLGVVLVLPLALVFAGESRRFWRRRAFYVAIPMGVFFAIFVAMYARLSSWETDRSLLEFRMRSQHLSDGLQAALQQQALFLEQLGATFATRRDPMTREDFRVLADKLLQRFPMLQAVEWSPRVRPEDREKFEQALRSELPGFTIHGNSRHELPSTAAGEGRNLYPVTYSEPVRGNEEAFGFDLASEADRRLAIERAVATGGVSATAPIRLVQEHEEQASVLLTSAVMDGATGPGLVVVVLRMGTFVQDLMAPLVSMVRVRLVDAGRQESPLFDTIEPRPLTPFFSTTFDFGNRAYVLQTAPTAMYVAAHRGLESWIVLVTGAFCTGLLGALLLLATGYAQRTRELVSARTAELQAANRRLASEIVERERAQSALLQARRMEAMGQLTGGVAHDFNNLLTVILGNLELLGRHVTGDRAARLLASAERGARRGAQLVDSLLAFARRQTLRPEIVDPNQLIQEFSELMRRATGEAIELRLMLDETAGLCRVDPAQFQAALLNLVINARDAMPAGGVLTIESRSVERSGAARTSEREAFSGGRYIAIVARDTGIGMPPEVVEHAFEPFYTTKDVGVGSGLGLSQVYGFVTQSGGQVEIASEPGAGTAVTIYLPQVQDGTPTVDHPCRDAAVPAQHKTILVVEDDPDVRELAAEMLHDLGYEIRTAADGPEAISLLQDGASIDLLFSDIVMPKGLRGDELARQAKNLRPELRVVLTSGYAETMTDMTGKITLLHKPYSRDELAEALRISLD